MRDGERLFPMVGGVDDVVRGGGAVVLAATGRGFQRRQCGGLVVSKVVR